MTKFLMLTLNEHKRDLKTINLSMMYIMSLLTAQIISEYPDVLVDKHRLKRKQCSETLIQGN